MIEYSWEILSLYTIPEKNGLTDVVKTVNWRFQASEGSDYADYYLTTDLSDPKSDTNFTSFDNLTDSQIYSWIQSEIDIDEVKNIVNEKIQNVKTPSIVEKRVPWNNKSKYNGNEEYLIVFDDNLDTVWGPMKWNSNRANNGLKEYGVTDYEFPFDVTMYQKGLLPINEPTVVNSRVKIYVVDHIESNPPEFNNLYQYNEGLSWVVDTGKVIGTYIIHDRTLDDTKKESINKIRQRKVEMNRGKTLDVTINGLSVNVNVNQNELSKLAIYKNMAAASASGSVLVECNNDEYHELNVVDIDTIISQVYDSYKTSIDWEKTKVESVIASTTIDSIKTIMQDV